MSGEVFIGLDVGGTYLKGARLDRSGKVAARLHEPIRKATPGEILDQLASAVVTLGGGETVQSVGIGLPGIVDFSKAKVRNAPNVPVLDGLRVGAEVEQRTGSPAFAENDANAAALAEAWMGAGRGASYVFFVTLGTGIGGGIVLNGRVWAGRSGYAGEIGHIQVEPNGLPCGCGSWGCLETVAGIPGWIRRAEALLATRDSRLKGALIEPKTIVEAAQEGDAVALEVVDETARAVGVGVAAALDLLNPDLVVVGGGVAQAGDFLLDRIVEQARLRTFPHIFGDVSFRLAELGGDAGVVGAARVGMIGIGEA